MIWKIQEKDGRSIKQRDKDISYAEEILITKSDLEEKVRSIIYIQGPSVRVKHNAQMHHGQNRESKKT